ncbi:histidine--tRNA ligase [Mobiluncus mulieris]|uniref:Histidine--tRNA ligase n=2 Tax=Mobiluncus mulieris TaxID=2052 RepID=E0QRN1_9ACTO|nr:histidine--tRNA ligase [Mobiluncus mulieris]EFM45739.1 histidine--tRNA ligase [Mobiluncus mulieris ATCC 35239]EFN92996.1 histidine--tRNA ligase [Mobiluncus mulieris FB024-16]MCU9970254.1 histidine--tRNA ligase [Mobiluncus mulieris]MCU9974717.1 histidine--tRNA ligase [Mobiluncus mulieris]MCU9993742.1 histidine--tRNA ligase [Mobiluncus mulieris]
MMTSLSGFPEFTPEEKILEDSLLATLQRVFELHGFSHLETRAVEPLSVLEKKGETSQEVYTLSRLQDKDSHEPVKNGLHFDLTVPLSRYVLENAHLLQFPFMRYQIQKVWRGERPQEGRFREFVQADIDMIARDTLPVHFEIEAPLIMAEALEALPIPQPVVHVNSRKILQGACNALGISEVDAVLQVIDKHDKVTPEVFSQMLLELQLDDAQVKTIWDLAGISGNEPEVASRVRDLGLKDDLLEEGLDDVARMLVAARARGRENVVADFKIARGLDYYTGMVYETFITGAETYGSICSGGRYDNLVSEGKRCFPGVGMSIGLTRLISIILANNWVEVSRSVPTAVLVLVDSEETRGESDQVAATLRQRGVCTEVSPTAAKYGKQIKYAANRGIPYVWFVSQREVKNILTGEQAVADPQTFEFETQLLKPQVRMQDA